MTSERRSPRVASSLEPHVAAAISYAGGLVTGLVLLVIEKDDRFVRFHAMQSTLTFSCVLVAHLILTGLPLVGRALYWPFIIGVTMLWLFLMTQAFLGKVYKLPYIGDLAGQELSKG